MADLRSLLEMRQAVPLSFSPDGARLLVASNIPGTHQLYVLPARGGELEQLTDFAEPVSGLFLPDGRVLVEIDAGGNERTQLYVLDDGGARASSSSTRASSTGRRTSAGTCSPIRRTAATASTSTSWRATSRAARSASSRSAATAASSRSRRTARASPSSESASRAATATSTSATSQTGEIEHVTPHDGRGRVLLGALARRPAGAHDERGPRHVRDRRRRRARRTSRTGISTAASTSAGRNLLVARERGRLLAADAPRSARRTSCASEVPLPGRGVVEHPVFSPDGSLLAFSFSSPVEPHDVYLYDIDAETLTRLTTSPREVDAGDARRADPAPLRELRRRVGAGLPLRARGRRARSRSSSPCTAARSRSGCRGSRRASRR